MLMVTAPKRTHPRFGEFAMSEDVTFADLIRRVCAGDHAAADRLVRDYEPAVRRVARIRLKDARLNRHLGSMDICQSVMVDFLARMARPDSQFVVTTPAKLLSLLAQIARNKVIDKARHEALGRPERVARSPKPIPRPSEVFVTKELYAKAWVELTEDERRLWTLYDAGKEWAEIAAVVGGSTDALRKQLNRALKRVHRKLEGGTGDE